MTVKFGLLGFLVVGVSLTVTTTCRAQLILVGVTSAVAGTGPQPTNRLVDIDISTGLATNSRDLGIAVVCGIATQPSTGALYGLSSFASSPANSLFLIEPQTGTTTIIGATGLSVIVEGDLAFNPVDGQLYGGKNVPNSNNRDLFRINPLNGVATIVGDLGSFGNTTDYSSLAFDGGGNLFIIDSAGVQNSKLLRVNPLNAQIISTLTMNVDLGNTVGMTFDPMSGTAFVADNEPTVSSGGTNSLYTLDVNTGIATLIGPTGDPHGISGLAFTAVPEPSSFLLVGFGGLVAWCRFRHTQNTKQAGDDAPACS